MHYKKVIWLIKRVKEPIFQNTKRVQTQQTSIWKKMLLFSSTYFPPLFSLQKSAVSLHECKVFWLLSWQTPNKPQFYLIANRGWKLCCKNMIWEPVQICSKNETDASTLRFSTSGLLEVLLSCANHPMAIFIPVWYLKPRIPIKSFQDQAWYYYLHFGVDIPKEMC